MGINGDQRTKGFSAFLESSWAGANLEHEIQKETSCVTRKWELSICTCMKIWGMICSPPTHKLHHGILYRSDKNFQSDSQTYHLAEPSHKDSIIPSPVCLILLACFFELLLSMAETPIPRSLVVYLMVRDWKTFVHTRNLAPPGMYGKKCRN